MALVDHPKRYCLVTVGATVGFRELTEAVLQPTFWKFLSSSGFTTLHIQCGPDIEWAIDKFASLENERPANLSIDIFHSRKNLMMEEMALCKAVDGSRQQGLIISHAGTGTILDAWKLNLPIIVVPNTRLLDNHQAELAKHLANEGYATMAKSSTDDLQEAIHKSGLLWEENRSRWPPNEAAPRKKASLRLWEIAPEEVSKEQNSQMAHD